MQQDHSQLVVLVSDRQALFRHGLIGLLRESWAEWSFHQADDYAATRHQAASFQPDLLLLDLELPGLQGADGVQRFRALYPDCMVIVLADTDERATILQCLTAGAQGYVLKSATPLQFLRGLETVLSGDVFAPATLSGKPSAVPFHPAAAEPQPQATLTLDPVLAQLTERQRDVFRLLAEGCATKTIARRLDLAVGTVKVHLAAIYRALDAHSRLEALAKARNGMMWTSMLMPAVSEEPTHSVEATAEI